MRIINVIETNVGIIENVQSFGVFEEKLVDDVVETAEKFFIEKIKAEEPDIDEDDLEIALDNGTWDNNNGYDISIIWSEI